MADLKLTEQFTDVLARFKNYPGEIADLVHILDNRFLIAIDRFAQGITQENFWTPRPRGDIAHHTRVIGFVHSLPDDYRDIPFKVATFLIERAGFQAKPGTPWLTQLAGMLDNKFTSKNRVTLELSRAGDGPDGPDNP